MDEGAGTAGGEPADRSGLGVSRAPALVRSERDGRFAGRGFSGGGEGPAVSVSGSAAGAPAGSFCAFATAMENAVRRAVRSGAVRPDQHVHGRRSRTKSESKAWVQPRRTSGLQAGSNRASDHAGRLSAGV